MNGMDVFSIFSEPYFVVFTQLLLLSVWSMPSQAIASSPAKRKTDKSAGKFHIWIIVHNVSVNQFKGRCSAKQGSQRKGLTGQRMSKTAQLFWFLLLWGYFRNTCIS